MSTNLIEKLKKTEDNLKITVKKFLPQPNKAQQQNRKPVLPGCKYERLADYFKAGGKFHDITFYILESSLKNNAHAVVDGEGSLHIIYYLDALIEPENIGRSVEAMINLKNNIKLVQEI